MLLFEGFCFPSLGFEVRVDLHLVSVIVGQCRMNLGQREMTKFP